MIALRQGGVALLIQGITDAGERDTLARVRENLGRGEHQDIIVGVAGHGGQEGLRVGMAQVTPVVHAEIGQVLHHDDVVLRGQAADDLQLVLLQTDPGRIVGIGIDDGGHVAAGEHLLQLGLQSGGPAVRIDVEFVPAYAQDAELRLLDGETRVDEEDLVLAGNALGTGDEGAERTGHRSRGRDAAARRDVHVDEGLHETRGRRLQFRHAGRCRILRSDAAVQRPLLGGHAVRVDGQAGRALVHADERDAGLLLQILGDEEYFADGRGRKVGHILLAASLRHELLAE